MIVVSKLLNDADRNQHAPPGIIDCNLDWATDIVLILDNLSQYGCKNDYDENSAKNKFYLAIEKNKYGNTTDVIHKIDFSVDFKSQFVTEV